MLLVCSCPAACAAAACGSSSDMVVRSIGNSLMVILPDLVGNKITNWFDLVRPLVAFQFQKVRLGAVTEVIHLQKVPKNLVW